MKKQFYCCVFRHLFVLVLVFLRGIVAVFIFVAIVAAVAVFCGDCGDCGIVEIVEIATNFVAVFFPGYYRVFKTATKILLIPPKKKKRNDTKQIKLK
jgi:hypothetical protein